MRKECTMASGSVVTACPTKFCIFNIDDKSDIYLNFPSRPVVLLYNCSCLSRMPRSILQHLLTPKMQCSNCQQDEPNTNEGTTPKIPVSNSQE